MGRRSFSQMVTGSVVRLVFERSVRGAMTRWPRSRASSDHSQRVRVTRRRSGWNRVVVGTVDERDLDRRSFERSGCGEAGEPAADDQYAMSHAAVVRPRLERSVRGAVYAAVDPGRAVDELAQ
jgi:hypothetical protein